MMKADFKRRSGLLLYLKNNDEKIKDFLKGFRIIYPVLYIHHVF